MIMCLEEIKEYESFFLSAEVRKEKEEAILNRDSEKLIRLLDTSENHAKKQAELI